ncbi:MAG: hypothetical protein ACT4TC_26720 [Myxococcaceae bacterium]
MRARPLPSTRALVRAVNERVKLLTTHTKMLVQTSQVMLEDVEQLGQIMTDLATKVDAHDSRLEALEKKLED